MPKRTSAKTLRRKPPLTKALLLYANDALALHNRLLKLAVKVEEAERTAEDRTPGHPHGTLRPRPCINCGGVFVPEQVGAWYCDKAACQANKAQRETYGGDLRSRLHTEEVAT